MTNPIQSNSAYPPAAGAGAGAAMAAMRMPPVAKTVKKVDAAYKGLGPLDSELTERILTYLDLKTAAISFRVSRSFRTHDTEFLWDTLCLSHLPNLSDLLKTAKKAVYWKKTAETHAQLTKKLRSHSSEDYSLLGIPVDGDCIFQLFTGNHFLAVKTNFQTAIHDVQFDENGRTKDFAAGYKGFSLISHDNQRVDMLMANSSFLVGAVLANEKTILKICDCAAEEGQKDLTTLYPNERHWLLCLQNQHLVSRTKDALVFWDLNTKEKLERELPLDKNGKVFTTGRMLGDYFVGLNKAAAQSSFVVYRLPAATYCGSYPFESKQPHSDDLSCTPNKLYFACTSNEIRCFEPKTGSITTVFSLRGNDSIKSFHVAYDYLICVRQRETPLLGLRHRRKTLHLDYYEMRTQTRLWECQLPGLPEDFCGIDVVNSSIALRTRENITVFPLGLDTLSAFFGPLNNEDQKDHH